MHVRPGAVHYDVTLMRADCAEKSWNDQDLARAISRAEGIGLSAAKMRVSRFFDGSSQTARTAGAIARALGRKSPRRYIRVSSINTDVKTHSPRKRTGEGSRETAAL